MLHIAVSTGQNITNLIPVMQPGIGVSRVWLLETATAQRSHWSAGLMGVLERRNITVKQIPLEGLDSDITGMIKKLKQLLEKEAEPVWWNLGGGQKPQQIACWETFKYRNETLEIPDKVCYTNQDDIGLLETWSFKEGLPKRSIERIKVNIGAAEIFKVFGFNIKGNPTLIYKDKKVCKTLDVFDWIPIPEFREFFFLLAATKQVNEQSTISPTTLHNYLKSSKSKFANLAADTVGRLIKILQNENGFISFDENYDFRLNKTNQSLKQSDFIRTIFNIIQDAIPVPIIEISNEVLKRKLSSDCIELNYKSFEILTDNHFHATGPYFEQVVIQRVKKLLETKPHPITEAYANLEIEKDGNTIAEYDVLCVTEKGTIIALDAKTFKFENKDIDARLYNLEKGSGFYRTFSAVFPYDWEDIGKSWFNTLASLPFDLNRKKFSFYIINDTNEPADFFINKDIVGKIIKSPNKPVEPGWIQCRNLDSFILHTSK